MGTTPENTGKNTIEEQYGDWTAPDTQSSNLTMEASVADTRLTDKLTLSEALKDEDLLRFFLLHAQEYAGGDEKVTPYALSQFQYFKRPREGLEPHIYVIKNADNVVAGASLTIENSGDQKLAYLGQKVVAPDSRQQNLGPQLVKKRLDVAREAGCSQAYCYVTKDNSRALRSILKGGFVVDDFFDEPPPSGHGKPPELWNVSKDLNKPELPVPDSETMKNAPIVNSSEEFGAAQIAIPFENKELIKLALKNGYVGRQIILPEQFNPEDQIQVKELKMFLEKIEPENQK